MRKMILIMALQISILPTVLAASDLPEDLHNRTLILGDSHESVLVNPVLVNSGSSSVIDSLVFNRLVRINLKGEFEPELAQSWQISADGRRYTFHLKKGVLFHDGVELTADDVLFTFQKVLDPQTHCPYQMTMENIEQMSIKGRYSFEISLKEPQPQFLHEMFREIIPKHLYENTDIHTNPFNQKPIGTGPFRWKARVASDHEVILEANPDYFEGVPSLAQIVFKSYATSQEAWSALMRGQIDLVRFISVEDYEFTKNDASFNAYQVGIADYYAIFYNLNDPILSDIKVRLALAHAVNAGELIDKVEKGYGNPSFGPFRESSWAFNKQVKPFSYNPVLAMKILKEAGWIDNDADGILEKKGKLLKIRIMADARDEKIEKILLFLRQQLQEVGIALDVQLYSSLDERTHLLFSKNIQADLSMILGSDLHPNHAAKFWHSQDTRKGSFGSASKFELEMDRLIESARQAPTKAKAQEIYQNFHQVLYQNQPACFLYFPLVFHATSKRVGGADLFLKSTYAPDCLIKDFFILTENKVKGEEVMVHGDHS